MNSNNERGISSEEEIIGSIVNGILESQERHIRTIISRVVAVGESPIERVFLAALMAYNLELPESMRCHPCLAYHGNSEIFDGTFVYPQAKVDGFRLDLLFIRQEKGAVAHTVVELDGHEFHDRTKRQASRDRARDRHFAKKGWRVLRYTGSDVWRDAAACVEEVFAIVEGFE